MVFEDYVEKLPASVSDVLNQHIGLRREKLQGKQCATLYFPFWFADAFGEGKAPVIRSLCLSNLFLYHYLTIVDDALDEQSCKWDAHLASAAHIMLKRATGTMTEICNDSPFFWTNFQTLLKEWLSYDLTLVARYSVLHNWANKPDTVAYAKKCGLMKSSGLALAATKERTELWDTVSDGYDQLAIAGTLIDDIVDWEDDLGNKQVTFVIARALNYLRINSIPASPPTDEVKKLVGAAMYLSGAVEDSLRLATAYLRGAIQRFENIESRYWADFGKALLEEGQELLFRIQDVKHYWTPTKITKVVNGRQTNAEVESLLQHTRRVFQRT